MKEREKYNLKEWYVAWQTIKLYRVWEVRDKMMGGGIWWLTGATDRNLLEKGETECGFCNDHHENGGLLKKQLFCYLLFWFLWPCLRPNWGAVGPVVLLEQGCMSEDKELAGATQPMYSWWCHRSRRILASKSSLCQGGRANLTWTVLVWILKILKVVWNSLQNSMWFAGKTWLKNLR